MSRFQADLFAVVAAAIAGGLFGLGMWLGQNNPRVAHPTKLRVRPIFAWFDLWIGVFVDRPRHRVYIFPIPCFGIVIERVAS